jgi:lysophospholipase L1-like esterase
VASRPASFEIALRKIVIALSTVMNSMLHAVPVSAMRVRSMAVRSGALVVLGLLSGCTSKSGTAANAGSANAGTSHAGTSGDAGQALGSGGSAGAGGGTADPAVRFIGRVDQSDAVGARFAWSGTGIVANFRGSSVAVKLSGGQEYTVVLDGTVQPKLTPTGSDVLASGLEDGPHTIELYRRTEASEGESQFLGFDFGSGELLAPPPASERRIELLGDSISCGYGDEGADMNCHFTPETENHYLSYGPLAARALGAELSTVAWSGKGVVCNYGDDATACTDPMPEYYDRVLPNRADSHWDFSSWQPQAVVINLGTNDFSTAVDPSDTDFDAAYVNLLAHLRAVYPGALLLCTVGPLLNGTDLTTARADIAAAVQTRNAAGDTQVETFELAPTDPANGYGCDYHPSLATHQVMADALTSVLRAKLGW